MKSPRCLLVQALYSLSTACRHLHLLGVGGHVRLRSCVSHASTALSKDRMNRRFAWFFGTAAVLAQGGGGGRELVK